MRKKRKVRNKSPEKRALAYERKKRTLWGNPLADETIELEGFVLDDLPNGLLAFEGRLHEQYKQFSLIFNEDTQKWIIYDGVKQKVLSRKHWDRRLAMRAFLFFSLRG